MGRTQKKWSWRLKWAGLVTSGVALSITVLAHFYSCCVPFGDPTNNSGGSLCLEDGHITAIPSGYLLEAAEVWYGRRAAILRYPSTGAYEQNYIFHVMRHALRL